MADPPVDVDTLAAALEGLSGGNLGQVLAQLRASRDSLQDQIMAGNAQLPPLDTSGLSGQFTLVNTWIRTLEAAVQPNPPDSANDDLLSAMQAVDQATAESAALNSLLVAIDNLVKSFGGG